MTAMYSTTIAVIFPNNYYKLPSIVFSTEHLHLFPTILQKSVFIKF